MIIFYLLPCIFQAISLSNSRYHEEPLCRGGAGLRVSHEKDAAGNLSWGPPQFEDCGVAYDIHAPVLGIQVCGRGKYLFSPYSCSLEKSTQIPKDIRAQHERFTADGGGEWINVELNRHEIYLKESSCYKRLC